MCSSRTGFPRLWPQGYCCSWRPVVVDWLPNIRGPYLSSYHAHMGVHGHDQWVTERYGHVSDIIMGIFPICRVLDTYSGCSRMQIQSRISAADHPRCRHPAVCRAGHHPHTAGRQCSAAHHERTRRAEPTGPTRDAHSSISWTAIRRSPEARPQ